MKSREIGGFFELELSDSGSIYHDNAIAVNTGRHALEYILKVNNYSKIYLPYFTCDAVLAVIIKAGVEFQFYSIGPDLQPNFQYSILKEEEALIYTNYFGLMDKEIERVISKFPNLIIDNAQAFYYIPKLQVPTFYSPRKFFGVSDGGFLYNTKNKILNLEKDISFERINHIIGRIEYSAKDFYENYKNSENSLSDEELKEMSKLTNLILSNIDYEKVKLNRQRNFSILKNAFYSLNEIAWPELSMEVPLCYPLLVKNGFEIKKRLIQNNVYVPTYWPNVFSWSNPGSIEYNLAENLICLPVDQRYAEEEMHEIINVVTKYT